MATQKTEAERAALRAVREQDAQKSREVKLLTREAVEANPRFQALLVAVEARKTK